VRIVTPNPHAFFNKAALAAVRDAKWPPVPAQIAHKTVILQLWVRFRLVHGG
jgi:outer membrane biosynthesis protein TonB